METSELVVELGVEEIPAGMLEDAVRQFADSLSRSLKQQRLSTGECTQWYTPRRMIVGIADIPVRQEDLKETITGPPKSVSYDASGTPTKAALAFAQKNGVSLKAIRCIQTPKGEYLSIERTIRGVATLKILQSLLDFMFFNGLGEELLGAGSYGLD